MIEWLMKSAQAAGESPASPAGGAQWITFLIFLAPILIFYYFFLHLPQRKRQQERTKMMNSLKRGDEVLTTGGLYGRVTGISDQSVNIEIAPKVRVKIAKSSISQITARSEDEAKTDE